MSAICLCALWIVAQAETPAAAPAAPADPASAPSPANAEASPQVPGAANPDAEPVPPDPVAPAASAPGVGATNGGSSAPSTEGRGLSPLDPPPPASGDALGEPPSPPLTVDDLGTPPPGPRRPGFSRRTWRDLCSNPAMTHDPACSSAQAVGATAVRPRVLRPRSWLAAAALGFGPGFGTGFYYAGDPVQGTIFVVLDAALWAGIAGWVVALNQLVIRNDFRTGNSLALGQRPMGEWEANYYALSWVAVLTLVASHVYQGIGGAVAAGRTNRTLAGVSIIPLEGGGSVQLGLGW